MSEIIRHYDAALGETIEIRWWRRIPDPGDPKKHLTQTIVDRHTAPPPTVWDARAKDEPHDE